MLLLLPAVRSTVDPRLYTNYLSTDRCNSHICSNPGTFGQCLSAPTGVNWQRVEVDTSSHTIYTFCDVNCGGGESGGQGGTYCAGPASGCAIGSL